MQPFHIIIPARYASTRLPGKPLLVIRGQSMICRVLERARASAAISVTVATDDARIMRAVESCGGTAVMTSPAHTCGAERINEAAEQLGLDARAIIVNLQGDEPGMPPALLAQVAQLLCARTDAAMATLYAPMENRAQGLDPAAVKVVVDRADNALYFSRAPIPSRAPAAMLHRHIGLYAYRRDYLQRFAARGQCELEKYENLEQLRALWHGEKIACARAVASPPPGVDTAEELARARKSL